MGVNTHYAAARRGRVKPTDVLTVFICEDGRNSSNTPSVESSYALGSTSSSKVADMLILCAPLQTVLRLRRQEQACLPDLRSLRGGLEESDISGTVWRGQLNTEKPNRFHLIEPSCWRAWAKAHWSKLVLNWNFFLKVKFHPQHNRKHNLWGENKNKMTCMFLANTVDLTEHTV